MTDLLDYVVEAHGGLNRWNELETVSAHLAQHGVTWEMVGHKACSTTFTSRHACMRSGCRTIRSARPAGACSLPNASRSRLTTELWSRHWTSRGPRSPARPRGRR